MASAATIGAERAGRLAAHLQSLGVIDPLSFSHSWCRWSHSSLSELTESEGKELIVQAKTAIKALGASGKPVPTNIKRYDVPEGAVFRPCRACQVSIAFIETETGAKLPVTREGSSHYLDCTNPKRFSKRDQA